MATDCQNGELEGDYSKSLLVIYISVLNFYLSPHLGGFQISQEQLPEVVASIPC